MIHPVGRPTVDRLGAHLRAGTLLDMIPYRSDGALLDGAEMQAWDLSHDVDADVVRELLRGRGVFGEPDPRGVRLRGVRIRGRLDLDGVRTTTALRLTDCLIEHGITAVGACLADLAVSRCRLGHPAESAINGVDLRVEGSVWLTDSYLHGDSDRPTVDLAGAVISGRLLANRSTVHNTAGPAVCADGLRTGGDVLLDAGFTATGHGGRGAVCLRSAEIGGAFICNGATLSNATGPALDADGLSTHGAVLLTAGFTAHGHGSLGAVRLTGARISGLLSCRAAMLSNPCGPALDAEGLTTGGDLLLDDGLTATGSGANGAIRLVGAHIGGRFRYRGAVVKRGTDPGHRWTVDGLVYTGVPIGADPAWDCASWLELLRTATPGYTAQPYRYLAAAYRAQGHDSAVRTILVAQRRDHLARGPLSRRDRCWGHATGWLLGYGYRNSRALWGLLGVLAVSVLLALLLGPAGALAHVPDAAVVTPAGRSPCTVVQTIGIGLGAPLVPASVAEPGGCAAMATPAGDILTVATWLLRVIAWTLVALFVAGFTRIIRRT